MKGGGHGECQPITGLTFVGLCAHTLEDDEGASNSSTHRKVAITQSPTCRSSRTAGQKKLLYYSLFPYIIYLSFYK